MRSLRFLVLFGAMIGAAFAQVRATTAPVKAPVVSATSPTFSISVAPVLATALTPQAIFDSAYWAHQAPPVAALQNMAGDFGAPTPSGRTSTAMALATQGYSVDVPIMVWGWDPYLVMLSREQYGYTWVPSALSAPVQMAPGVAEAGQIPYDAANPPAGSIKVSLALSDYPPYLSPVSAPPPAVPSASCVGVATGAGFYSAINGAGCPANDGQVYSGDGRGTFVFHLSVSPFAPNGVRWYTAQ